MLNYKAYKILFVYVIAVVLQLFKINIVCSIFICGIIMFYLLKKSGYFPKTYSLFFMGSLVINTLIHYFRNNCEYGTTAIHHIITMFLFLVINIFYSICIYNEVEHKENKWYIIKKIGGINFCFLLIFVIKFNISNYICKYNILNGYLLNKISFYFIFDILICGIIVLLMYKLISRFVFINKAQYTGILIPIIFIPSGFFIPISFVYLFVKIHSS